MATANKKTKPSHKAAWWMITKEYTKSCCCKLKRIKVLFVGAIRSTHTQLKTLVSLLRLFLKCVSPYTATHLTSHWINLAAITWKIKSKSEMPALIKKERVNSFSSRTESTSSRGCKLFSTLSRKTATNQINLKAENKKINRRNSN